MGRTIPEVLFTSRNNNGLVKGCTGLVNDFGLGAAQRPKLVGVVFDFFQIDMKILNQLEYQLKMVDHLFALLTNLNIFVCILNTFVYNPLNKIINKIL